MKRRYWLLMGLLACKYTFAGPTPYVEASQQPNQLHTQGVGTAKQLPAGTLPSALTGEPSTVGTGYFEVVGGFGEGKSTIGKSRLGVSNNESDWLVQTSNNWYPTFAHAGLGYVYHLSEVKRGYAQTWVWFPSIETMISAYYFNAPAKGKVYRFKDSNFYTQNFNIPITSTRLMLDIFLNIFSYKRATLYLLGGMGNAWTTMSYDDSPKSGNPNARPGLSLKSNSQTNGTYEWGGGIKFSTSRRTALSLQYLYTHIGNVKPSGSGTLGGAPDLQIRPPGFSLRTQAMMLDFHVALS